MTDTPTGETMTIPEPTPAPSEQEVSADELLSFDAEATVAATVPTEQPGAATVAAPVEPPPPPAPIGVHQEDAVCPTCGTAGAVDFTRRDSLDFCRVCDYPLFWSRDRIVMPSTDGPDDSGLRRLPGTAGRAVLASLLCPTCAEPNPATGVTCVRCGSDLHLKPVVEAVVAAPLPEPVVEVEPEPQGWRWWPILVAGGLAVVALVVVLLVLYV